MKKAVHRFSAVPLVIASLAAGVGFASGASSTEPTHVRMVAPRLLPALPTKPYVDLGPVRLPKGTREEAVERVLFAVAERLRADGYVVEELPLKVAYGAVPDPYRDALLALERRKPIRAGENPLVADPPEGPIAWGFGPRPSKPGNPLPHDFVYRFVRYDRDSPAHVVPEVAGIDSSVRELLSRPTLLRDQLLLLHQLAVRAIISDNAYEAMRTALCS